MFGSDVSLATIVGLSIHLYMATNAVHGSALKGRKLRRAGIHVWTSSQKMIAFTKPSNRKLLRNTMEMTHVDRNNPLSCSWLDMVYNNNPLDCSLSRIKYKNNPTRNYAESEPLNAICTDWVFVIRKNNPPYQNWLRPQTRNSRL